MGGKCLVSINGAPQNGWLNMTNPVKLDDLGIPPFMETSRWSLKKADVTKIGWWEKFWPESPIAYIRWTIVSCWFSLEPIHWTWPHNQVTWEEGVQHNAHQGISSGHLIQLRKHHVAMHHVDAYQNHKGPRAPFVYTCKYQIIYIYIYIC